MNGSTWSGAYAHLPQVAKEWDIAAVADFNGDGKPDLVWQNTSSGQRSIWFMNGSAWSGSYALLQTVPPAWRIAAAADFDGDNKPDLVWQNISTGERSIWLMNGSTWNGAYAVLSTVSTQWDIGGVLFGGAATLVANAGVDQDKNRGESVTLDGSASTATGATVNWTQVPGPD